MVTAENKIAKGNQRIKELEAEVAELKALLKRLEWQEDMIGDYPPYCRVCENDQPDGHKPDCEIKKALEGALDIDNQ